MAEQGLPPLRVPQPVASSVLAALNHVLSQNDWARAALAPHAGADVLIRVRGPLGDIESRAAIAADGGVEWRADEDTPCRVVLVAALSPALLPSLMRDGAAALMRSVRVEGDAELAAALAKVVQGARWDAEDDLSRVVGDIAARRLVATASDLARSARDGLARAESSALGFLVDEDPLLVARAALEQFRGDLRRLRDDTDRLEKRIALLERSAAQVDSIGAGGEAGASGERSG